MYMHMIKMKEVSKYGKTNVSPIIVNENVHYYNYLGYYCPVA